MRKNCLFIIAISALQLSTFAQPVLNSTDFTLNYVSDTYRLNNISNLSQGNAGANQTWDFSQLPTLSSNGNFSIVPYASSPYAATFPTANLTFKTTTTDVPDPSYTYYKLTSANLETVGEESSTGSQLELDHYIMFEFPYIYNTVINDTYQFQDEPTIITTTSTYDGYGTLITPFDTFTNVIRQKSVQIYSSSFSTTFYTWQTTNPFKVIMGVGFINGIVTSNFVEVYTNFTALGVNDFKKESTIVLYPNPTSAFLNLRLANNQAIERVVVTDILGKKVLEQNKNTAQINVESLSAGLYIVEVYNATEKYQTKFLKE